MQPFGQNTPTSQTDRTDRQRSDSIGRTVLQTVAQKQHDRRNLVCSFMLRVNFVHRQIVTGWTIILHICFTQNPGLKFNIKIQMPYFNNTHKYCGYFHNTHKYCGNRHLD